MIQHEAPLASPANGHLDVVAPGVGVETEVTDAVNLNDVLDVVFRRRWLIISTILAVFVCGMIFTLLQPKRYQATCSILVSSSHSASKESDISIISDLQALTEARSVDTQVQILNSNDHLKRALARLNLTDTAFMRAFHNPIMPRKFIRIEGKKNADIIDITVLAYDKRVAVDFANSIADTYFDEDRKVNQEETNQAIREVHASLIDIHAQLNSAHKQLADYKEKTGLISPDAQLSKIATNLLDLRTATNDTKTALYANAHLLTEVNQQIKKVTPSVISATAVSLNPRFAAVIGNIDTLFAQRAQLQQEYSANSPEVKALDGQIKELQGQLKKVAETIVTQQTHTFNPLLEILVEKYAGALADQSVNTARLTALTTQYASATKEASMLPQQERKLTEYMQQVQLLSNTYDMLTTKNQELLISMQSTLAGGRTISEATPPIDPESPRPKLNAVLFLFFGMILAVMLALLLERIDDRIHDQNSAEVISGAITMTVIPELSADAPKLITEVDRHSPFLESFRVLRNNIAFTAVDKVLHTLAVTSPGSSEGKSTICANLAIIMAMDGKRVVVVDFDLHRPSMHNVMKRPRDVGFTSVLTGSSKLSDAVVPTDVPNVFFLPTGPLPPNSTEILNSQAARQLFAQLREEYDAVVVDCPPCTKLSDVQVISTLVDGMLLLLALDRTLKTGLQMTTRSLRQVNAPLIGIVLNRMDIRNRRYGYYYSYYYSYRYEEAEGTDGTTVRTRVKDKGKSHSHKKLKFR